MKTVCQHKKNNTNLTFYTIYSEDLALQFNCVVGSNVYHRFPLHIHNSLCIGLITKGERNIVWSDNTSTKINRNELFVINKHQPHAIDQLMPHNYIAITIKGDSSNVMFKNLIQSDTAVDLFLSFYKAIKDNNRSMLTIKWLNLYNYLVDKQQLSSLLLLNKGFVTKALDYIRVNHAYQISVDDIANHVCVSTYHFCRLFKQLTGLSPHNYLKQYRLSQSFKCLQKNTSVFDTAIETGFYDSSHFIKTFRTYMGQFLPKNIKSL